MHRSRSSGARAGRVGGRDWRRPEYGWLQIELERQLLQECRIRRCASLLLEAVGKQYGDRLQLADTVPNGDSERGMAKSMPALLEIRDRLGPSKAHRAR